MSDEKIQIKIIEPLPCFRDVIDPISTFPSVIGERVAVNAVNPLEVREMVLAKIERDKILDLLKK